MPRINWRDSVEGKTILFAEPRNRTVKKLLNDAIILIDEREQLPWSFKFSKRVRLDVGDYSAVVSGLDLREIFVVERKGSPSEFVDTVARERKRFENELHKLSKIPMRLVICEFTIEDLILELSGRRVADTAVFGTLVAWQTCFGIPFLFLPDRENARLAFLKALEFAIKANFVETF